MTKRDFILSILTSLIATILFELGRKFYLRFRQLLINVLAFRHPLKIAILNSYQFLKDTAYQFLKTAFLAFKSAKLAIKHHTSSFVLKQTEHIRFYAVVLDNRFHLRFASLVLLPLVVAGMSVFIMLWGPLGRLNPSRDRLEMELARLNSTPPAQFADSTSHTSYSVIEIKTSTDPEGKFAYVRLPKELYSGDVSSLQLKVNSIQNDCRASVMSKDGQVLAELSNIPFSTNKTLSNYMNLTF
jgi:hypothetical protein